MKNINLYRKIDYYAGIPLCFFLSLAARIFQFKNKKIVDRVLLIKLSELGTIIQLRQLVQSLKDNYHSENIFFLTFHTNKALLEIIGYVPNKNIICIRTDSILNFVFDSFKALKIIRSLNLSITMDLDFFSRFTAILAFLSKAPKRVGFYKYHFEGLYRGQLFTHKVPYNPLIHISLMFNAFANEICCQNKNTPTLQKPNILDSSFSLNLKKEDLEIVSSLLKEYKINSKHRIILINPGNNILPLREWPLTNYIELSNKILEHEDNIIITIGDQSSQEKNQIITNELSSCRVINLNNKLTISQLLCLFQKTKALITNDSGLIHLASLQNIASMALFGPETPLVFHPNNPNCYILYESLPCSPCFSVFNHRQSSCKDNLCLKAISPSKVIKILKENILSERDCREMPEKFITRSIEKHSFSELPVFNYE
jgi:ADP-heptose:LPS heptosyltransferase